MISLTLPAKTESRQDVAEFFSAVLPVQAYDGIYIEASTTDVDSPEFADELIRQTLVGRKAPRLVVSNPSIACAKQLVTASEANEVGEKLIFRMTG